MSRLFWFGAGVAAGAALYRKANATARRATPSGVAEQLGGAVRELAGAVGSFGADVRAGMTEREDELREVADSAGTGGRRSTVDAGRVPAHGVSGHGAAGHGTPAAPARARRARRAGR